MFFFFSSRRRHTRSKRDWSSDVCSSDLLIFAILLPLSSARLLLLFLQHILVFSTGLLLLRRSLPQSKRSRIAGSRSEERRVGKEWRSKWGTRLWNKNDDQYINVE